jgi:hypothetical protein
MSVPGSAEAVVETFIKTAPQLISLGLYGHLTTAALLNVAMHWGNHLRHLFLSIPAEVEITSLTEHCTALESLCCYGAGEGSHSTVVRFIAAQKGLLSLNVKSLSITDAYLEALVDNCPKLQEILLQGTTGYTAAGLAKLIDGCPHVRRVQVGADDQMVTEMVRLLWARVRPGVIFDHSAIAQACWQ